MKKIIYVVMLLIACLMIALLYFWVMNRSFVLKGEVVEVIDGDTFRVKLESGKIARVRLKCIDFPDLVPEERKKKWIERYGVRENILVECYNKGIYMLQNMILGKNVIILQDEPFEKDRYGRILGYVIINGTDINKMLVEEGFALPYICDKYKNVFTYKGCLWR